MCFCIFYISIIHICHECLIKSSTAGVTSLMEPMTVVLHMAAPLQPLLMVSLRAEVKMHAGGHGNKHRHTIKRCTLFRGTRTSFSGEDQGIKHLPNSPYAQLG